MPKASLKRLGGGRWQTPDGRFTIESSSGRWVVVDSEHADELGLPRVHGPYGSLGDAKDAIETVREAPAEDSPLAAALEEAKTRPPLPDVVPDAPARTRARAARDRPSPAGDAPGDGDATAGGAADTPEADPEPEPPAWLAALRGARRTRAEALLAALEAIGHADPEGLTQEDLEGDDPVAARALLAARLRELLPDVDEAIVERVVALGADTPPADGLPGWRLTEVTPAGGTGRAFG